MAKKNFSVTTKTRSARPRSKRLRDTGGIAQTSTGGGTGQEGAYGDLHTHANKEALDALSIDKQDYLYITQQHDVPVDMSQTASAEDQTEPDGVMQTHKAKAGFADDAAHAATAEEALHAVHADEAVHAAQADNADKWDGNRFDDFLDQSVRRGDDVQFKKVTLNGFQTPDFASGISGAGGRMDNNGAAELDSLFVRRFIETPELRYNRVDVMVGDKWCAPAAGVIKGVYTTEKIIELKLEEGEVGSVKAGDICMGIFHAQDAAANAAEDYDDSCGNRRFAGFATCYFRVTEILDSRCGRFRYQLRPASDNYPSPFEPCAAMTFVGYGSLSDPTRQSSRYDTRTYQRYLCDVSDWEFSAANIAAQFGDLTNLSVHGLEMSGYSAYLNNIYMSGTIRQFTPDGEEIPTINDRGRWETGKTYNKNDDVYHNDARWRCLLDGTISEPSIEATAWVLLAEALKGDAGARGEKGDKGETGPAGSQGIPGTSSYFHVKYSANSDGNPMSDTPNTFIGTAVTNSPTAPASYTAYKWVRLEGAQGPQGEQGIPGTDGEDGRTSYLHIKYSDDGGKTFTANNGETPGDYIGQYVDFTAADSSDVSAYSWSKVKGDQGDKGDPGVPGTPGADGRQGCIIRISEWAAGVEYRNDSELQTNGLRYIDIVTRLYMGRNQYRYRCRKTHVATTQNGPMPLMVVDAPWSIVNDMTPIYTPLLLADNASINFLQGNSIKIMDSSRNVYASLSAGDYPLVIGGESHANAPFHVSNAGALTATNANIKGVIEATSGKIGKFDIAVGSEYGLESVVEKTRHYISASVDYLTYGSNTDSKYRDISLYAQNLAGQNRIAASIKIKENITADNYNIGLAISSEGLYNNNHEFWSCGNHALYIEKGTTCGFRPYSRVITADATLRDMDTVIYANIDYGDIQIFLPATPQDNQFYIVRKGGTKGWLTVNGNGKQIADKNSNAWKPVFSWQDTTARHYLYNKHGNFWISW